MVEAHIHGYVGEQGHLRRVAPWRHEHIFEESILVDQIDDVTARVARDILMDQLESAVTC